MPLHPTRVISGGPPSGLSSSGHRMRPGKGEFVDMVRLIQTPPRGSIIQAHGEEKTAQATAGFQDKTDFISSQKISSNFREPQSTQSLPDVPFPHLTGSSLHRRKAAFLITLVEPPRRSELTGRFQPDPEVAVLPLLSCLSSLLPADTPNCRVPVIFNHGSLPIFSLPSPAPSSRQSCGSVRT